MRITSFYADSLRTRLTNYSLATLGVFGPLKTAYREQVELLFHGGGNIIGKQHLTFLYSRARQAAFTPRNIRSRWSKAGLYPFNPEKVLAELYTPVTESATVQSETHFTSDSHSYKHPVCTPTTAASFSALRSKVEGGLNAFDSDARLCFEKLANAGENVFAERTLLRHRNGILVEQNNEKKVRQSARATVVGKAKIMSYKEIEEARKKRDEKEARKARAAERKSKSRQSAAKAFKQRDSREEDVGTTEAGVGSFEAT